jgi:hypothetical protein
MTHSPLAALGSKTSWTNDRAKATEAKLPAVQTLEVLKRLVAPANLEAVLDELEAIWQ